MPTPCYSHTTPGGGGRNSQPTFQGPEIRLLACPLLKLPVDWISQECDRLLSKLPKDGKVRILLHAREGFVLNCINHIEELNNHGFEVASELKKQKLSPQFSLLMKIFYQSSLGVQHTIAERYNSAFLDMTRPLPQFAGGSGPQLIENGIFALREKVCYLHLKYPQISFDFGLVTPSYKAWLADMRMQAVMRDASAEIGRGHARGAFVDFARVLRLITERDEQYREDLFSLLQSTKTAHPMVAITEFTNFAALDLKLRNSGLRATAALIPDCADQPVLGVERAIRGQLLGRLFTLDDAQIQRAIAEHLVYLYGSLPEEVPKTKIDLELVVQIDRAGRWAPAFLDSLKKALKRADGGTWSHSQIGAKVRQCLADITGP